MKKNTLKRFLALGLSVAMILGTAACGNDDAGTGRSGAGSGQESQGGQDGGQESRESQDSGQESQGGSQEAEGEEPYQLDLFMYDTGSLSNSAAVEEELTKLTLEKINCTVKIHLVDGATYGDKMNLEMTSKTKMDLVNSAFGGKYHYLAGSGMYTPLEDYLNGEYSNLYDLVGHEFTDGTKVNGHIYALPVNKEKGETNGWGFNAELVEKYNFDLSTIKTYKDVEPWLDIIAQNEPDITPLAVPSAGIFNLFAVYSEPVYYNGLVRMSTTEPYKVVSPIDDVKSQELFDWVHAMYEKGYVNKDALTDITGDNSPAREYKFFCFSSNLKPGFAEESAAKYGGRLVCVDLQEPFMPFTQSVGSMMSIPSTSQNPDKAMAFINLLYTDKDVYNTLVFGIEGVNYEMTGENRAKTLDGSSWSNWSWAYGNQFLSYLMNDEPDNKYTQFEDFNAACRPSDILGFAIDADKTSDLFNACTVVFDQYRQALLIGAVDWREIKDEFQEALDGAGYQELLAEIQAELDAWVAENK